MLHQQAVAHFESGRLVDGLRLCEEILSLQPEHMGALSLAAMASAQLGNLSQALGFLRTEAALNPRHAPVHNNLGTVFQQLGQLSQAEAAYRRAVQFAPDYVEAYSNLGGVLRRLGRLGEAEAACRRALEIRPDDPVTQFNLGNVLRDLNKPEPAENAYRRAFEIEPGYADAYGGLAHMLEQMNRVSAAKSVAVAGLKASPDDPFLNCIVARCERREGNIQQATTRLLAFQNTRLSVDIAKDINFELGNLFDLSGDAAKAVLHYSEANALAARNAVDIGLDRIVYLREVDELYAFFSKLDAWPATPGPKQATTPLFLIGFPRSGTTLLEVVLDAHPKLQTLSEKPVVQGLKEFLRTTNAGYPGALTDLTHDQVHRMREIYFKAAYRYIEPHPDGLLIDKLPLSICDVGLILRVFPGAKFILALRHPYDVCLSCFMQSFKLNEANVNFFSLEDAARLYAKVMTLWQQYVRTLPVNYHVVKYETLVDDFEPEVRRLLAFIGVDWSDKVLHYAESVKARQDENTPSYHQVAEPLYRRARYRWRRYEQQIGAVRSTLSPYAEYFGYRS